MNKSAASAASPDYVILQAVIKSAASEPPRGEAGLVADLVTVSFLQSLVMLEAKN